jgi:hypothetical protein
MKKITTFKELFKYKPKMLWFFITWIILGTVYYFSSNNSPALGFFFTVFSFGHLYWVLSSS